VLVAYRTNPHWDLAPTGFRAGNRLIRALRGQISPVHAWRKLPLVLGGGTTIDFLPPMRSVFRLDEARSSDDVRVLTASLFMVHPYTTAEDLGWAVHVSTDGDRALADTPGRRARRARVGAAQGAAAAHARRWTRRST
jgi:microcystin degradation protein MlrC